MTGNGPTGNRPMDPAMDDDILSARLDRDAFRGNAHRDSFIRENLRDFRRDVFVASVARCKQGQDREGKHGQV